MKKPIILASICLTSLLLVACSSTSTSKTNASKAESTQKSSSQKTKESATEKVMDLEQISKGDFTSVQGTWKNNAGKSLSFDAQGNEFSGKKTTYSHPDTADGRLVMNAQTEGDSNSTTVIFVPKGVAVQSGIHDQSDKTKDRIVVAEGKLTSEQTKTEVYYRLQTILP